MSPEAYLVGGVILSLIFFEVTDVSPGGLLVPGFIALCLELGRTDKLLLVVAIAVATALIVSFAGRFLIFFGRRRFAVFLLAGFAIRVIVEAALPGVDSSLSALEAIGWLVPGILASDLNRQGALSTFSALAAVTALLKLVSMAATGNL